MEKLNKVEITKEEPEKKNPLVIFKTDYDKTGFDIMKMSNFFDDYVQVLSLELKECSKFEMVSQISVSDIGIINDVVQQMSSISKSGTTFIPDFDSLPKSIKKKVEKGIYKIGESKQVNGNYRSVILDENNVRVKDITLKKIVEDCDNQEFIRSISNQLQMRQIYNKLSDIEDLQNFQIEQVRNQNIIAPFIEARSFILEAETKQTIDEKLEYYKKADENINKALCNIYADMHTVSEELGKKCDINIFKSIFKKSKKTYMMYLIQDIQIASKYVGVSMQILDYVGNKEQSNIRLKSFYGAINQLLTNSVSKNNKTAMELIHDNFPYNKENMNSWYYFSENIKPVIEKSINNENLENIYLVTVEGESCND